MTSFEEQMQVAQARRREATEAQRQVEESHARYLCEIWDRSQVLLPEVDKAAAAVRRSGRRPPQRHDQWWFYGGTSACRFTIPMKGQIMVCLGKRDLTLADFINEAEISWVDEDWTPTPGLYLPCPRYLVRADQALEQLLREIAEYLTTPDTA